MQKQKFIVHLFPTIRIKLKELIEAEDYEQAVDVAMKKIRPRDYVDSGEYGYTDVVVEDAEECNYALVDVAVDEDFQKSRWVHLDVGKSWGDQLLPVLRELYRTAKNVADHHGPMSEYSQAMDDAHDLLQQIDDDVQAQRKGP